ncbi:response regulator transcription factor [Uliginosibacterium sp. H1]|uniref:response regulator transcription factor n=1 Tax=Uliginosibacterium sp. H1 TaxID=3114757 RepID=UPI002E170583|nr:response regulator transcription factor [Uliginosibacterium sp. H1]
MHAPIHRDTPAPRGILVVDDHDLVRLGLRTLIQAHVAHSPHSPNGPGSATVWEARTLADALDCYRERGSDIGLVLLDLHLPDAEGLGGLQRFLQAFPAARVVVLSGNSDPALMRQALADGASAFLAKSADLDAVIHYIASLGLLGATGVDMPQAAASPTAPLPAVAPLGARPDLRVDARIMAQLTPRQAQVLDWILSGLSNREIALRAHLTEGTVKNHVSALLLQFGVRSRAQLISLLR